MARGAVGSERAVVCGVADSGAAAFLFAGEFAAVPVENGRYLADHIEGARLVVLPGRDGWIFTAAARES
jgi:hypothetical protein